MLFFIAIVACVFAICISEIIKASANSKKLEELEKLEFETAREKDPDVRARLDALIVEQRNEVAERKLKNAREWANEIKKMRRFLVVVILIAFLLLLLVMYCSAI